MYAIKISETNRYISYFDKCWYETSNCPLFIYDYNQAKAAFDTLKSHYIYKIEIVSENGEIEILNAFNKSNPMLANENQIAPAKKNIAKVRISDMKKYFQNAAKNN